MTIGDTMLMIVDDGRAREKMTNSVHIDTKLMMAVEDISDVDPIEVRILKKRAVDAEDHLLSFNWCTSVKKLWFAGGFSSVAVFFAQIESVNYDENLWVIVGDLPPAHLVIDDIPDFKEALLSYVYHMRKWVSAVKKGRSTRNCIPVNVIPDIKNAEMLEVRLDFIERNYAPSIGGNG